MHRSMALLSLLGALAWSLPVQAQFGRKPPPASPTAAPRIDCAALARMPNAPMTQQTCEAMMQQATTIQGSMASGKGARPGDAAMTCEAIKAELAVQQNVGVSRQHLAENQQASSDYIARQKKIDAQSKALMAQQTATSVAGAALSVIPGVGNAAATAVAASNAAQSQAFAARANAEMTPARQRMLAATTGSLGDVAQSMQENPRFARLAALMQEKRCK